MQDNFQAKLFEDSQERSPDSSVKRTLAVLVPYPVDKAYDYRVPDHVNVSIGDYVLVPLGNREVTGVVWSEGRDDVKPEKLKAIISRYDLEPMRDVTRKFIDWVANYTLSPKGFVLKMALSAPAGFYSPKPATGYVIADDVAGQKVTPHRQKVLDVMGDGRVRTASEVSALAEVSSGVVRGMAGKGLLNAVSIISPAPCVDPDPENGMADLSPEQQMVADELCDDVRSGEFRPSLVDGVTGAGKTEVYFEAVAEALKAGRQVLILLPEIALSNAFLDRFRVRFGCPPALWHSHLTPAQRRDAWRGVASGETRVVVGARSALFLPYIDLGLIVVDEEHDQAYKQEDGVIYHARDMAVVRAHLGKISVVLVSATPSLETMMNAWEGRYNHLILESRYGGARLPEISVVDLREDKPERQCFLSKTMVEQVQKTVDAGEQALLFLNRRGYAPLTLCRTCGHRMECPRCTAWLVEHKRSGKLHCHHCGFHASIPALCPSCDDKDSFAACGPGVERIFDETRALFPDVRIMILASDMAESPEELKAMLAQISAGEVDIIIGTQIIAKGHHFPNLTFVGVVDADLGLKGGDLRVAERIYQLLNQVAGRAGRAEKPGRVLLQSWMPEHRIMKAMVDGSRDDFLAVEAAEREVAHMPPYSRLVGVIVAGRNEGQVKDIAMALGRIAPQGAREDGCKVQTLGPAPAPFARLRGRYRYRLLVRADKGVDAQKTVADWMNAVKVPSTVRVYIDVDPQSFL